jgi:hypothetical protein
MSSAAFKLSRLQATIVAAGIPIDGVSGDQSGVRVDFQASATPAQQTQAASIVSSFDWSDAADATYKDAQQPDFSAMRDQAQAAFDGNTAYLAIGAPTNAQVVAQVRALTQQNQKVIKALAVLVVRGL